MESLNQIGSSLLAHAGESAVRSIALALAAGLVMNVVRFKQPRLRLLSWTGVLYAAMLMPLLGLIIPSINVRLLPVQPEQAMLESPAVAASAGPRAAGIPEPDKRGATANSTTVEPAVTLPGTSEPTDTGLAIEETHVAKTRDGSSAAMDGRAFSWGLALFGYLVVLAVL